MSSIATPASSSRRTASAIAPAALARAARAPSRPRRTARVAGDRRERRDRAASRSAASEPDSSRSPPTCALSSSGVPSAITRPWSITAMRSARRSASSRYWVVRSTVVPSATSASIALPEADAAAGSRPVVGSSRKSTGGRATSAGGEVEAPAHAARVGLHEPVAGVARSNASSSSSARSRERRAGRGGRAARPSRGSRSRSGSRRRRRTGRRARSARARRAASRDDVEAARRARCRRRARSSVVRIRTAVVLPAPFGPSRPKTLPGLDAAGRRREEPRPSP